MTVYKINPDGSEEAIEMCQVRRGDFFYTVDGAQGENKGPVLHAQEDANQRPHPTRPGHFVWGCKASVASLEARLVLAEKQGVLAHPQLAVCIGCDCDDFHACTDTSDGLPCHWLRLDREAGLGVCSNCPDHLADWDAGIRVPYAARKDSAAAPLPNELEV
jgi:hypothetical protein